MRKKVDPLSVLYRKCTAIITATVYSYLLDIMAYRIIGLLYIPVRWNWCAPSQMGIGWRRWCRQWPSYHNVEVECAWARVCFGIVYYYDIYAHLQIRVTCIHSFLSAYEHTRMYIYYSDYKFGKIIKYGVLCRVLYILHKSTYYILSDPDKAQNNSDIDTDEYDDAVAAGSRQMRESTAKCFHF